MWWYTKTLNAGFEAAHELAEAQISFSESIADKLREVAEKQAQLELPCKLLDSITAQLSQVRQDKLRAEAEVEALTRNNTELRAESTELSNYTRQTRAELSIQSRGSSIVLSELRRRPEDLVSTAERQARDMDALYVAFENTFRGTREDIKSRLAVYLPILESAGIGKPDKPVLDLGCGRGEWLELLGEQGFCAKGVDRNGAMIVMCRSLNVEVSEGDALDYLSALDDSSIGAVTAFHIVEHLPFEALIALLDECLRVLKPGGLLILETPNPTNVLVGSNNFYLDPTHVHPLPPAMLRFFVDGRGYSESRILELHPYPATAMLPDEGDLVAKRINEHFYGPQDYAVIARRP